VRRALAIGAICLVGLALVLAFGCGKDEDKPPDPVPVTNNAPVLYPPTWTECDVSSGAKLVLDFRYRYHGCDPNGQVTGVSGAYDPDGDDLEYRFSCDWTIFNEDYDVLNDEWVTFPMDSTGEVQAIVCLFVGWDEDFPPYPFKIMGAGAEVGISGCKPSVSSVRVDYAVRDGEGGSAMGVVVIE